MNLGGRLAAMAAVSLCLGLAACGAPTAKPHRQVVMVIDKLTFGPAPAGLAVGDTVRWENKDIFEHSATARDGSFDVDLPAGGTGTTVLTRAGTVQFYCRFHPGMTGALSVGS